VGFTVCEGQRTTVVIARPQNSDIFFPRSLAVSVHQRQELGRLMAAFLPILYTVR